MKTPFDAVLRVRQRAIDAMRLSISVELTQRDALAAAQAEIGIALQHEANVAADDWTLPAAAFAARKRAERSAQARHLSALDARLDLLRRQAARAYGEMAAIESTADRFRTEARQRSDTAEQGRIDDFSAARFNRMRRVRSQQPAIARDADA